MGDRCFVRIRIGGEITPAGIEALLRANYSVQIELEEITHAITTGTELDVEAEEVNYGNVEDIEEACKAHGLAYSIYTGEGDNYGAESKYWSPGMPETTYRDMTHDGDYALTAGVLHNITKNETSKAKKFDAVLRWFCLKHDIPPLTHAPGCATDPSNEPTAQPPQNQP